MQAGYKSEDFDAYNLKRVCTDLGRLSDLMVASTCVCYGRRYLFGFCGRRFGRSFCAQHSFAQNQADLTSLIGIPPRRQISPMERIRPIPPAIANVAWSPRVIVSGAAIRPLMPPPPKKAI